MESTPKPKVVIIGAGLSGLSAALALQNSGLVDVCVLEASERIGGRVHTSALEGETVEMGAGWIHDSKNNPLYTLAIERGIPLIRGFNCDASEYDVLKFYTLGEVNEPSTQLVGKLYEVYDQIYENCAEIALEGDIAKLNRYASIGKYIEEKIEAYLEADPKRTEQKRSIFEWLMRNECHSCGVQSLRRVDIKSSHEYETDEENSFIIPSGYDKLIACAFVDLNPDVLKFNHEVKNVKWHIEARPDSMVTVLCNNGQTFRADHVIVTVPLGVLKFRHQVLFDPPLPEIKINAIQRLGFGLINRIFLVFEKAFWSDEYAGMALLWPSTLVSSDWPSWVRELYLFYPIKKGSHVLVTWLSGETAIEVENISDKDIGKACVNVLKAFTGIQQLPELLRVEKTSWYKNKLSRGSYTYIVKNSSSTEIDILATPVPQHEAESGAAPLQLLFAGEATHRTAYATAHGAYLTGLREARRIIEYIKNQDNH